MASTYERIVMSERTAKDDSPSHSRIEHHQFQGKTLIPPLLGIPNLQFNSWVNDRLPEMVWAVLLVSELPRTEALDVFRDLAEYTARFRNGSTVYDVTVSGLSRLQPEVLDGALNVLTLTDQRRKALLPILLLRDLPSREKWDPKIAMRTEPETDWSRLTLAISRSFDHQSQEATDCHWARVICMMASGKLLFPPNLEEIGKELVSYPLYGDMRKVRPSIRACELMLPIEGGGDWAGKFWDQCFRETPCMRFEDAKELVSGPSVSLDHLQKIRNLLVDHAIQTMRITSIDPRRDSIFGIPLYCLSMLIELESTGLNKSIIGRLALRTIVESFITLAYLKQKDDPDLWRSWRVFGAGQAKLSYLKLEDAANQPRFVDSALLKTLANEDAWEEFLPIELGHWTNSDVRKLSIEAGVKDEYDNFYSWTSTFSHGHWGAIRDTVFETCLNPLHRFHRVPRVSVKFMPDLLPDAYRLMDRMLEIVSISCPRFPYRVSSKTEALD